MGAYESAHRYDNDGILDSIYDASTAAMLDRVDTLIKAVETWIDAGEVE